jgi:hypothetical protein
MGCAFALNGRREAASAARRAVLARNGVLPACVREDVLLLVTELVTNAVRRAEVGPEQSLRVELASITSWWRTSRATRSSHRRSSIDSRGRAGTARGRPLYPHSEGPPAATGRPPRWW